MRGTCGRRPAALFLVRHRLGSLGNIRERNRAGPKGERLRFTRGFTRRARTFDDVEVVQQQLLHRYTQLQGGMGGGWAQVLSLLFPTPSTMHVRLPML